MSLLHVCVGILVAINAIALIVMVHDKRRSHNARKRRQPEGVLFFIASIGGSIGIYLGMLLFRHKTKKWYFQIGIPLILLQNLATIYMIAQYTDLSF